MHFPFTIDKRLGIYFMVMLMAFLWKLILRCNFVIETRVQEYLHLNQSYRNFIVNVYRYTKLGQGTFSNCVKSKNAKFMR